MIDNDQGHLTQRLVMNIPETADFLRISEAKLRRFVSGKRIPHFRLDNRVLFLRSSLEEWIRTRIIVPEEQVKDEDVASTIWKKHIGE